MADKKPIANPIDSSKTVSGNIDFKKDILPYRVVRVYAGVGSGKNYWARQLADPSYTGKDYSVLYITSRKAVANTEASKLGAKRTIKIEDFVDSDDFSAMGEPKRIIYATNSTIESFMSKTYLKNIKKKEAHIWKKLDFVVIDECHSLTTDATFSSAPYYVDRFLRLAYDENPKLRFIFMTGTPEPIEWFFNDIKGKGISVNEINLYDKCYCVKPTEIKLCQQEYAQNKIKNHLKDGKKIIYFVRKISDIAAFYKEITDKAILQKESIGVGFSKEEKVSAFEGNESYVKKSKEQLEKHIKEKEQLPNNIQLFISTSQNKEGVNITNDDIDYMVVESTFHNEIIQMAGRARKGIKGLYIVYDTDFTNDMALYEADRDTRLLPQFNAVLDAYKTTGNTLYRDYFLEDIPKKYSNIRYDPFLKESKDGFVLYEGRTRGNVSRHLDQFYLNEMIIKNWDEPFNALPPEEPMVLCSEYFEQDWFPGATVHLCARITKKEKAEILEENRAKADAEIKGTLKSKGWYYKDISRSNIAVGEEIIAIICATYDKYGISHAKEYKNLGNALMLCGLAKEDVGGRDPKKTKDPKYRIIDRNHMDEIKATKAKMKK